jgi:hypothetical protein
VSLDAGARAPYNRFGGARHVADTYPPFLPGLVVALTCACGYATDWHRIECESAARVELNTHECPLNKS